MTRLTSKQLNNAETILTDRGFELQGSLVYNPDLEIHMDNKLIGYLNYMDKIIIIEDPKFEYLEYVVTQPIIRCEL